MTTILVTFIASFFFILVATPWVKKLALHYGLVDNPSSRKVHKVPVPRIGGVAIFLSFLFPFGLLFLVREQTMPAQIFFEDSRVIGFILGACMVFILGLVDDIRGLSSSIKFVGQITAALVAWYWGFRIEIVTIPFSDSLSLGYFALPVTVFWFVLVINAINLVDGLDGLAAGICLFVSLTMLFICGPHNTLIVESLAFAALGGTLLGFLRYNFNPASIFMGDSGSYFLGYSLAALSISGSIKGQVATAMLIPIIALGVPLIDTLWAPIRRFVLGRKLFQPDSRHFHHKLIKRGYTHRRAVLSIYTLTIILGLGAVTLVHSQDDTAALVLVVLGAGVVFLFRFLGVTDVITMRRMVNWARDISDEAGISHDRRSFLSHQLEIGNAQDLDSLWAAVCRSLADLEFDSAEFSYFITDPTPDAKPEKYDFSWQRNSDETSEPLSRFYLLKIELPLHCINRKDCRNFGTLVLVKDMRTAVASHYTLKRVEHLRRTIISTLLKISS